MWSPTVEDSVTHYSLQSISVILCLAQNQILRYYHELINTVALNGPIPLQTWDAQPPYPNSQSDNFIDKHA